MIRGRCQLCGRRKGLNREGRIVMHHVRGDRCAGTHKLPIEQDHSALESEIAALRARARAKRAFVRDLLAHRINFIDPVHERQAQAADDRADTLARRLRRHLTWPARFARQMERQGYGDPPPTYLRARFEQGALA